MIADSTMLRENWAVASRPCRRDPRTARLWI